MISGGIVRDGCAYTNPAYCNYSCDPRYEVQSVQDFNNDGSVDLVVHPICSVWEEPTLWLQDGEGVWNSIPRSDGKFICDDFLSPLNFLKSLFGEICYYKPEKFVLWTDKPWRVVAPTSSTSFGIGDKAITEDGAEGLIHSFYIYVDPQYNVVGRSAYLGFDDGRGQEYDLDQLKKTGGGNI